MVCLKLKDTFLFSPGYDFSNLLANSALHFVLDLGRINEVVAEGRTSVENLCAGWGDQKG